MMSRILFVAPRLPEFDRESGSRRLYHLIQRFVQADWFVTLVVENQTKGARYVHRLQQQGVLVYGGTQYRNLPDLLQTVEYDVIFFMFWYVAERFLDPARTLSPDSCLVVDTVDLHLLRQARTYVQQQRPLDAAYASEMRRELNVYIQSDVVVTVSEKESHWINNMLGIPGRALTVPDSESIIRHLYLCRHAREFCLSVISAIRPMKRLSATGWKTSRPGCRRR